MTDKVIALRASRFIQQWTAYDNPVQVAAAELAFAREIKDAVQTALRDERSAFLEIVQRDKCSEASHRMSVEVLKRMQMSGKVTTPEKRPLVG